MKVRTLLLISVILFIVMNSCSSAKKAGSGVSDTDRSHNSMNSLDWEGIYTGLLPCADCEGIQTVIKLNRDL